MTNMRDDILETRLRETLRAVAEAPITPGRMPTLTDPRRPRVARRMTTVLVVAAIVIVFFVPLPHASLFTRLVTPSKKTTPSTVVPVGSNVTSTNVAPTTVTRSTQGLPQSVVGSEQSLDAVAVPTWFRYTSRCSTVVGQPLAFSVGDSSPIVVWHGSMSARKPMCPTIPVSAPVSANVEYEGNGLAGTGYDGVAGSSGTVAGTATSLFLIAPWPVAGQQVYVWAYLPSDIAYVTYSFEGKDLAWVKPQSGVAAFLVPRPAAFDGPYAVWHTAPFPIVTAYNTSGQQLAQERAPRVDGDDFETSAT